MSIEVNGALECFWRTQRTAVSYEHFIQWVDALGQELLRMNQAYPWGPYAYNVTANAPAVDPLWSEEIEVSKVDADSPWVITSWTQDAAKSGRIV
jgi:hypothetical protein